MISNLTKLRQIIFIIALLFFSGQATAGTTGSLAGTITDKESGQTLKGAFINVVDAGVYTVSDKYGNYIINGLQPGTYKVEVQFIGFANFSYQKVQIKTDVTTRINFELAPTVIQTDPIIITGIRNPIQEETTSTVHYIDNDELNSNLPTDNYLDSFKYIPGIFANHFRGSRTGEVLYLVDGVPIVSSLTRELAFDIPNSAIEEIVVYTGGFSAEYGNANAGVVNIVRKRERNHFDFTAKTFTDYFGVSNVPHDNNQRIQIGFGGPVTMSFGGPVLESNYYISVDANITDTPQREVLRSSFDETIQKNLNGSFVYDIKLSKNVNVSFQTALSQWSWREIEESSVDPILALPLRKNNHLNTSIGLTHTVTPSVFYKITLGYNRLHDSIEGSVPDTLDPIIISDNPAPVSTLNLNIAPWEQRIRENIYYANANIFKQVGKTLQFKAGVNAEYYDIAMNAEKLVVQPNRIAIDPADNKYAYTKFINDFRKFPFTLASYAEARFQLPFFIAQFGVRLDYLNPNTSIAFETNGGINSGTIHRSFDTKSTVSPRIALSAPLSKSDFIYFNYGKYNQIPSLYHLYAGANPSLEETPFQPLFGNPDLKPMQSINYELSYSKNFSLATNVKITGFSRKYSDLLDSESLRRAQSDNNDVSSRFVNRAFGETRGLELHLVHTFSSKFEGQAIYTFMESRGTANNPEENYTELVRTGFNYKEQISSLNWDQRHSFIFAANAQLGNLRLHASSRLYSPRKWVSQTTTSTISAKLPFRNLLDMKVMYLAKSNSVKFFPFIEIRNLFNVTYKEYRDTLSLFNSQPLIPFQEQFGRRIRIGLQIN
ncbi:MAG: TonB-dependent receptor domain-containing protein [bacterium]